MVFNPKDAYFKKAKKLQYAARSIFKLEEIDQKMRLFRSGQTVIDLGCAPGSWMQYVMSRIGPQGVVIGADLKPLSVSIPGSFFFQQDAQTVDFKEIAQKNQIRFPVDYVLSDMAPATTGIKITDQARSLDLCLLALSIAKKNLKVSGGFVCKLFHLPEFDEFTRDLKKDFQTVQALRPQSTRKQSKEIFIIAKGFLGLSHSQKENLEG
jgi:23S rRNA (uridine2552-2'-O)-methyltransferase